MAEDGVVDLDGLVGGASTVPGTSTLTLGEKRNDILEASTDGQEEQDPLGNVKGPVEIEPTLERVEDFAWALMETQRVCQKETQVHWAALEEGRRALEAELINLAALVNIKKTEQQSAESRATDGKDFGGGESEFHAGNNCSSQEETNVKQEDAPTQAGNDEGHDLDELAALQANSTQSCRTVAKSGSTEVNTVSSQVMSAPPAAERLVFKPHSAFTLKDGKKRVGGQFGVQVTPSVRQSQLDRSKSTLLKLIEAAESEEEKTVETKKAQTNRMQPAWLRMVRSTKFDLWVGVLIVANVMIMSLQLEYNGWLSDPRCVDPCDASWDLAEQTFLVLEQIFTFLFAMELGLRLCADGIKYLKPVGNALDAVIVLVSAIDSWVLTPLGSEGMSNVAILRLVRLVRLSKVLRVVRVMKAFKSLRVLVSAVAASVGALAWSMTLLFVLELSGAIFLAQVLRPFIEDPEREEKTREFLWLRFGTWVRAMLTIFEITMAPGGFIQYRRLCDEVHPVLGLVFAVYVCIVTFAVVRVITALFLKATLSASNQDEQRLQEAKAKQREAFAKRLLDAVKTKGGDYEDSDASHIEKGELRKLLEIPRMREWMKDVELHVPEAERLFEALDPGTGMINFPDFVNCLIRMRGPPRAADAMVVLHESRRILEWLDRIDGMLALNFGKSSRASIGLSKLSERVRDIQIRPSVFKKERMVHL